jgi:hypothetical protein
MRLLDIPMVSKFGVLAGRRAVNDVEHFYTCTACGQPVDMRLRQVLWHEQRPTHEVLDLSAEPLELSTEH